MNLPLLLFSLAVVLFLALCFALHASPIKRSKTNNTKIDVELLFEHDGCRVYRFQDCGQYIYFVKGGSHTEWTIRRSGNPASNRVDTV